MNEKTIGTYAKAIAGAVVAGGTAAVTALGDGNISVAEWITIAVATLTATTLVWAIKNMPAGVAKYGKTITSGLIAALGALSTGYVADQVIGSADLINVGIALFAGLGLVAATPNAAFSDDLTPEPVLVAVDDVDFPVLDEVIVEEEDVLDLPRLS